MQSILKTLVLLIVVGCVTTSSHAGVIYAPILPQAGSGEVVAVRTQNSGPAQPVSFGQAFKPGTVPNGQTLRNGQLDVKTRYGDGSVRFGVVTMPAPAGTATTMLALGAPLGGVVSLPVALASESIMVTLSGGVTATLDIGRAISASTDYWLQGPLATQARIDIPVVGALHVIADVTAYADGRIVTDLNFANDYAMEPTGGTRSYTATIRRNGAVIYTSPALTHYQYQQWRWTERGSDVNVQADVRYLLGAGVLPNYDVANGIESTAIAGHSYTPLGAAGITKYMPGTGGRDDIGPITNANALWLLSQDAAAKRTALAQASAAASIPWHFFSRNRGEYLSLDDYPTLWADGRGNPTLTQPIGEPTWTPDTAHQPNLSFVPYLLTGERFHLDQINAQATFALLWTWNTPRQNGLGIVVNDGEQVRSQAWNFRQISDAAWANPVGATSGYWQRILNNNLNYLRDTIRPRMDNLVGSVAGYAWGDYRGDASGRRQIAPWQQDFLASSVATAALRGSNSARTHLEWAAGWLVGRFNHGYAAAVSYIYNVGPNSSAWYRSWAELEAANGTSADLPTDGGYWVPLGLQTLALVDGVTGSPVARDLYAAIKAKNAPGTSAAAYRAEYAQFAVVPAGTVVEPPPPPPPPPPPVDNIPQSLWADTLTGPRNQDGTAWQLGTAFTPTVNGTITHIRVYSVGESGRHTAAIWNNATGNRLFSTSWTYSGTGWRKVALSTPLTVQAGRSYTVSVTTGSDTGRGYAGIVDALSSPGSNGRNLTYLANAGVYGTNLTARPTQVWRATNYLRDVVFQPNSP